MDLEEQKQQKRKNTLRDRLGDEAYRDHMAVIGAKGGAARVSKGFSVSKKHIEYSKLRAKLRREREKDAE